MRRASLLLIALGCSVLGCSLITHDRASRVCELIAGAQSSGERELIVRYCASDSVLSFQRVSGDSVGFRVLPLATAPPGCTDWLVRPPQDP